ncbi:YdeI/OmpD-associated family protein [Microbulbifer taiwanensis]|uniref:YdeI/OmpD-associated family protein n=1 Tax=Microbulbifer taiwanensis TaxID=986746 RepID=A0ABW1YQK2_9GAMM|nr:YdeI/OmpD-associated family protein [Microbulbifer taiwanensis]
MKKSDTTAQFKAKLLRPINASADAPWAFVVLPQDASAKLPRRGRTTVVGAINGHVFQARLEPDGQLSHWLRVGQELLDAAESTYGDIVDFEIMPAEQEPEPEVPSDLQEALAAAPEAHSVWEATTTIARLDWIHWITSAKQPKTRVKRIDDACRMLASGKRRVCCFDPSGYYSKAFRAPKAVN